MTSPGATLAAMRPTRSFVCAWCGRAFMAKDTRAKFCSNRCRQANKYKKMKAIKEENK